MRMISFYLRGILLISVSGLLLPACSIFDKVLPTKADYKQSRTEPALEIPPDLSSANIKDPLVVLSQPGESGATYSDFAGAVQNNPQVANTVLPVQKDIQVQRDGDKHWLIVQGDADAAWQKIKDFWLQNGFLISMEDPRIGIMETDWAENRADIPQGPVRKVLGTVLDSLYSAATRDKFRIRLERGDQTGTTEIFLTHRGVEEVIQGAPDEETGAVWRPRPSDPELETEMLKRMMVFLGTEEEKAVRQLAQKSVEKPKANLIKSASGASLQIEEDFSRAWRRAGIALDRVGFTVEDRDRSQGVYFVRYRDPLKGQKKEGILSRLAFWNDKGDEQDTAQYRIKLQSKGEATEVIVQDNDGKQDNSPTAARILTLMHEQLQ